MTLAPSIKVAATEFPIPSQEPDARLVNASGIAPSPVASAVSSAATRTTSVLGSIPIDPDLLRKFRDRHPQGSIVVVRISRTLIRSGGGDPSLCAIPAGTLRRAGAGRR